MEKSLLNSKCDLSLFSYLLIVTGIAILFCIIVCEGKVIYMGLYNGNKVFLYITYTLCNRTIAGQGKGIAPDWTWWHTPLMPHSGGRGRQMSVSSRIGWFT